LRREGREVHIDTTKFDVNLRTAPLDNVNNILNLESAIPDDLLQEIEPTTYTSNRIMSKTLPTTIGEVIRAAVPRLTSVTSRKIR
jgi:hypothetical protein